MAEIDFKKLAASIEKDVIGWRRHFHQYPELSNKEFQTSRFIQKLLEKMGISYREVAGTGVIAEISGNGNKVIGLRCDMDALPVTEQTGLKFSSKYPGIMHACGHDAHMAIVLGVAKIFSSMKKLPFSVRFLFQPAEESIPCGAPRMIKEGAIDQMKHLIGFHVWAGLNTGEFSVNKGPVMASADRFTIVIKGKGGHGSSPHKAIDPIVASAYFIIQLQAIVSRQSDPQSPLVVSVGKITAGDAFNIIPDQVELLGTVRTYDQKQNTMVEKSMKKMLKGLEKGFGVKTEIRYEGFVPATYNNPELSERVIEILRNRFGNQSVKTDEKPTMGSEDFSFYSQKIPSCYINVGCGKSQFFHHSSKFNIDEHCLAIGVEAMATIVWNIGCK
ncbi:MAG TPA: M20 family metallopeptidase [bacterium]|nr:M20 family metallopeptidase [bacterium]HOL34987.1 M20 family metallopeptidase [bacterium]HPP08387.1 M20 family metallopeptidase [bacterium]